MIRGLGTFMGRIIIVPCNLGLELGLGLHRFRVKVRARDGIRDRVSAVQIINILNAQCTLWNAEHNISIVLIHRMHLTGIINYSRLLVHLRVSPRGRGGAELAGGAPGRGGDRASPTGGGGGRRGEPGLGRGWIQDAT